MSNKRDLYPFATLQSETRAIIEKFATDMLAVAERATKKNSSFDHDGWKECVESYRFDLVNEKYGDFLPRLDITLLDERRAA